MRDAPRPRQARGSGPGPTVPVSEIHTRFSFQLSPELPDIRSSAFASSIVIGESFFAILAGGRRRAPKLKGPIRARLRACRDALSVYRRNPGGTLAGRMNLPG